MPPFNPATLGPMELLLLSNSTNYRSRMFAHAADAFAEVVAGSRVIFVPYALADWDDYADRVAAAFDASASRPSRRTGRAHRTRPSWGPRW